MPLFNRYLFADYSGGGEHHERQSNIRLYAGSESAAPLRLYPPEGTHFSRDTLREAVLAELDWATANNQRVIFGFDHQFSWPGYLWGVAGLGDLGWREAVRALAEGEGARPPLDIPRRFCAAFNAYAGWDVFWSPLKGKAAQYGIPTARPDIDGADRFRLCEWLGNLKPKPADAVGGMGEGIVGGQTICGLYQIARMLDRADVAWWPFDGLDVTAPAYAGKHAGIEIYPSIMRPPGVGQTDDHDALHSCLYVRDADRRGDLLTMLTLSGQLAAAHHARVLKEGWIVGMQIPLL